MSQKEIQRALDKLVIEVGWDKHARDLEKELLNVCRLQLKLRKLLSSNRSWTFQAQLKLEDKNHSRRGY